MAEAPKPTATTRTASPAPARASATTDEQDRIQEARERRADERVEAILSAERDAAVRRAPTSAADERTAKLQEAAARAEQAVDEEHAETERAYERARQAAREAVTLTDFQVDEITRVTANMPEGPEQDQEIAARMSGSVNHVTEQIRYGGTPPPAPPPIEPPPPPEAPAADSEASARRSPELAEGSRGDAPRSSRSS